jgi:formate/nitrite transporter FocA (FNT family)
MFLETVNQFATVATTKIAFLRRSPLGFWLSSMMAGAYVGLGIILIFCVGANVDPSIRPIVMGASFGIALTLVIFAGSDLFTGHTMFMTFGWLRDGRACEILPRAGAPPGRAISQAASCSLRFSWPGAAASRWPARAR